jgi:ABC-type multidrug transport system fused ATPase/permease subunit
VIVVLERGRVVEGGRHEELLARPGGAYAKLYAMQLVAGRRPVGVPVGQGSE